CVCVREGAGVYRCSVSVCVFVQVCFGARLSWHSHAGSLVCVCVCVCCVVCVCLCLCLFAFVCRFVCVCVCGGTSQLNSILFIYHRISKCPKATERQAQLFLL